MLEFNEASAQARALAIHYATLVGGRELIDFMSGRSDVASKEVAAGLIEGFWKMTDLAIEDFQQGEQVEGITDIEFWMHKLFNKVYGYMTKNGFQEQWDEIAGQR